MTQLLLCLFLALELLLLSISHAFLLSSPGKLQVRNPYHGRYREASLSLPVVVQSQTSSSSSSLFDWSSEWYPVSPVRDLSRTTPNKITLLGKDFCVWYDEKNDTWSAFADSCPHRLVPLSEGRLERGFLQCAYHGWEFDSQGSCVKIPQVASPSTFRAPMAACATSFPVQVAQELLWLFPKDDSELAKSKAPALIPQLDDPNNVDATNMYCRDLPYSWQVLVENLCDPTHVVYAHHSVMRGVDRYSEDEINKVNMNVVALSKEGFTAEREPVPVNGRYQVRFQPPCLLYYDVSNTRALRENLSDEQKARTYVGLGSYCIPTTPDSCRLIARFPFSIPVLAVMFALKYTPRWITHFSQNIVIDSDVVFLTKQDEQLQQLADKQRPKYYLPTRTDGMVLAFRKWLEAFGSPIHWLGIPAARSTSSGHPTSWIRVPQRYGRDALLDRYRQHTEICSSCRQAHRRLYQLRNVLTITSMALLAAASTLQRCKKLQVATAVTSLLMFLTPRLLLQPLIERLECVPWPRKKWIEEPIKRKEVRVY